MRIWIVIKIVISLLDIVPLRVDAPFVSFHQLNHFLEWETLQLLPNPGHHVWISNLLEPSYRDLRHDKSWCQIRAARGNEEDIQTAAAALTVFILGAAAAWEHTLSQCSKTFFFFWHHSSSSTVKCRFQYPSKLSTDSSCFHFHTEPISCGLTTSA